MIEAIIQGIVEIVFQGFILGMFKGVKLVGIFVLKILTLSKEPIEELKKKYKDSSMPYFIGFAVLGGIIYLLIQLID